jgi:hypothetical protein
MTRLCLLSSVFCLLLASCAAPREFLPTTTTYQLDAAGNRVAETVTQDGLIAASVAQSQARAACYAAQAQSETPPPPVDMAKWSPTMVYSYNLSQQQQQVFSMLADLLAGGDRCAPETNIFDMTARETESARAANTALGGKIANVAGIVGAVFGLGYVLDNVQGATTVNGDGNSNIANNNSVRQYQTAGQTTGDNSTTAAAESAGGYDPSLGCSYETWFSNGGFCP